MFNLLEKLRTKSRAQRTFIAFSISLLCTGVIFVTWLVAERAPENVETVQVIAEHTPTNTLFKNVGDIWGGVVNVMQDAQETIKSIDISSTIEYSTSTSTPSNIATSTP